MNADSDEVMFYCGGDYEARKGSGIRQGSISLHHAVRKAFHSFGTCSIDDPRSELTELGLLDPTPDATHQGAS